MEQFSSDCSVCGGRGRDVGAGNDALSTVMGFICPMRSSIAPHPWLQSGPTAVPCEVLALG